MLHSITWLQFSGFLAFSLLAYYGYVSIRYYWAGYMGLGEGT